MGVGYEVRCIWMQQCSRMEFKSLSTRELRDACHIAIKSLRNSSDDIKMKVDEFLRTRVVGSQRGHDRCDIEAYWEFCLIRADLMPWFVAADPWWDGEILWVDAGFLATRNAMMILALMFMYMLQHDDWSETRWCKVKLASRKMIRSESCGMRQLVRLTQNDRDA